MGCSAITRDHESTIGSVDFFLDCTVQLRHPHHTFSHHQAREKKRARFIQVSTPGWDHTRFERPPVYLDAYGARYGMLHHSYMEMQSVKIKFGDLFGHFTRSMVYLHPSSNDAMQVVGTHHPSCVNGAIYSDDPFFLTS